MFWQSVVHGLGVLAQYEVWVGLVLYMAGVFLFLGALFLLGSNEKLEALGCLMQVLIGPAYQGVLVGFFICLTLPTLVGGDGFAPVATLVELTGHIVGAAIGSAIAITLIMFIPILGSMISSMPPVQYFIQGVIILRILTGDAFQMLATQAGLAGAPYPGFLASIGYICIAAALGFVVAFGMASSAVKWEEAGELKKASMAKNVGLPTVGVLSALVPLFMYITYVRIGITGG